MSHSPFQQAWCITWFSLKNLSSGDGCVFPEIMGMSFCHYINANIHTEIQELQVPNNILIYWLKIQQLKVVVLLGGNVKKIKNVKVKNMKGKNKNKSLHLWEFQILWPFVPGLKKGQFQVQRNWRRLKSKYKEVSGYGRTQQQRLWEEVWCSDWGRQGPESIYLNAWSPVDGTLWEGVEDVTRYEL